MDRLEHPPVARTSAEVAADGLPDGQVARVGVRLQQRSGGNDQARRAKAALHRSGVYERLLDVAETVISGDPLDCRYLPARRSGGQHQAGTHGLSVDEDRAGSALALLAGVLGPRQAEPFAQHTQEALPRVGIGHLVAPAVHLQDERVRAHDDDTRFRTLVRDRCARTRTAWRR